MKCRQAWSSLLLILLTACASAPVGSNPGSFTTPDLPFQEKYCVFLPPSYHSSNRSYPVLYFLHDIYSGRAVLFKQRVAAKLTAAMRKNELPEFLIVCPEGDHSWFANYYGGAKNYEAMVARDLPPEIERRFRVLPGVRNRAITGISMGGDAAVRIALHHPDEYGAVSSLSGALVPFEWDGIKLMPFLVRRELYSIFGDSPDRNNLAQNDVWRLLQAKAAWRVPFHVFLLGGAQDKYRLGKVALQYADYLNRHGIRAFARVEPGVHDWPYWRTAFLEIARWHGEQFTRGGSAPGKE